MNEVKSVIVVREVLQVQDEAEVDEAKEGEEVQDPRLVDHAEGGLSEFFGHFKFQLKKSFDMLLVLSYRGHHHAVVCVAPCCHSRFMMSSFVVLPCLLILTEPLYMLPVSCST